MVDVHAAGISIIPYECGKYLLWDATTPNMFAPTHLTLVVRGGGEVAHMQMSGVFGPDVFKFIPELGLQMA